ncbi:MAG: phosphoribosylformylglycinamidine synthase, partial [Firmicutes bacterium]|nr:phosphoribosylformylglycinamidine synthase [Bacillota bacterium]
MVYRIFVEKKPGLDNEARAIRNDINELLQIKGVEKVRLFNRYDVEDLAQDLFEYSVNTVFAEPQLDIVTKELPEADCIFAVEPLPGQFDQRASSAAECIQIISKGERPTVKTAKVYALYGKISEEELAAIKKYVINAVESREAAMQLPETLAVHYDIPTT